MFAQIYVHSKVMISDSMAIVGSGNINHRRYAHSSYSPRSSFLSLPILTLNFYIYLSYSSLDGDGDSEIGVLVTSSQFATRLVKKLLSEHTGEPETAITDIANFMISKLYPFTSFHLLLTSLLDQVQLIASQNTTCFHEVYPAVEAKSVKEYV